MIPFQTFRLTRSEGRGHRFWPSGSRNTLGASRTRRVRKSIRRRCATGLVMISAPLLAHWGRRRGSGSACDARRLSTGRSIRAWRTLCGGQSAHAIRADVRGIVGNGGNTSARIGRLADGSERGTKRGSRRPAYPPVVVSSPGAASALTGRPQNGFRALRAIQPTADPDTGGSDNQGDRCTTPRTLGRTDEG
jgi:hypothetical protein